MAIIFYYAPLFFAVFIQRVAHFAGFTRPENTRAWLSFSLHENGQKIKPADVFFTEKS
jgi:hypothetical protein